MHFLQLLFRASSAALLLVLCLQLGTNKAQENTRKVVIMNVTMPKAATPNEEVSVTMEVRTELKECVVITASLLSHIPIEGPFNYKYSGCLCKDHPRTFYWDFRISETLRIAAVTYINEQQGICPNDEAVLPLGARTFYIIKSIIVH